MVQVLASRAAGYRLGLLVSLLLLPILYFGSILINNSLDSYRLAQANGAGVQLQDLTMRTMLDIVSGWSVSDQQKKLLEAGPSLAQQAGVVKEFEYINGTLTIGVSSRDTNVRYASELIKAIGSGPLLNSGGNSEANKIATAAAIWLPDILADYSKMQTLSDHSMLSVGVAVQNLEVITALTADLSLRTGEFRNAINSARSVSAKPDAYAGLILDIDRLSVKINLFKSIASLDQADALSKMQKMSSVLRNANVTFLSNILVTWNELNDRLIKISDERISQLRYSIARTVGFALAAVVFSLGMAIRMFRNTLTQLDDLEVAKKAAENARFVAEGGSAELAQVNNNLAEMNKEVSQHLKALEEAQEQLVKKGRMEQMGQLTATMAHELRNPLGAARTSIFLLERKTRGKGLGVESQIQRITNAIMRCDDIITQLLDFSRTKKLSPTSADFDAWLEKIVTDEAMRLPQALSISVELGTGGTPIAFDPSRMQRAITNLLNNASEAMVGTGDDSTKFAVPNPRIDIRSAVVNGQLELTVADNGPGISPENLARVREPLFTTKSFGTGLGLPAVEQIAAQHGGSMKITSEVGQGTTATILLPLEPAQEAA